MVIQSAIATCKKLDFRILKFGVWAQSDVYEFEFHTNAPKHQCLPDFFIEMRLKGFHIVECVTIHETHFIGKIKECP